MGRPGQRSGEHHLPADTSCACSLSVMHCTRSGGCYAACSVRFWSGCLFVLCIFWHTAAFTPAPPWLCGLCDLAVQNPWVALGLLGHPRSAALLCPCLRRPDRFGSAPRRRRRVGCEIILHEIKLHFRFVVNSAARDCLF